MVPVHYYVEHQTPRTTRQQNLTLNSNNIRSIRWIRIDTDLLELV